MLSRETSSRHGGTTLQSQCSENYRVRLVDGLIGVLECSQANEALLKTYNDRVSAIIDWFG